MENKGKRGAYSPVTEEMIGAVVALAATGKSYRQIGAELGIPRSTVYEIAKSRGISRGGANLGAVPWTDEMKSTLAGSWRAGIGDKDIAARLGLTKDAVVKQRRRMGLTNLSGR